MAGTDTRRPGGFPALVLCLLVNPRATCSCTRDFPGRQTRSAASRPGETSEEKEQARERQCGGRSFRPLDSIPPGVWEASS